MATKGRELLEWEYLSQARINRAIAGDFSKTIKNSLRTIRRVGQGTTILSGALSVTEFTLSDKSWGDYGRLGVGLLSTGLTYTPEPITTGFGIGIGAIDAFGGFNGFYNYLDNQQQFYNQTGAISITIIGVPSLIFLK